MYLHIHRYPHYYYHYYELVFAFQATAVLLHSSASSARFFIELASVMELKNVQWECVEECETMEACQQYIHRSELLQHRGKPVKFKWHPARSGDGVRTATFACKTHLDCPFVVRGHQVERGRFEVQTAKGVKHKSVPATLRKGCVVTQEQLRQVAKMMDAGALPGRILNNLTMAEGRRCKRLKIEPVKRARGGLEGAYSLSTSSYSAHLLEYTENIFRIHG